MGKKQSDVLKKMSKVLVADDELLTLFNDLITVSGKGIYAVIGARTGLEAVRSFKALCPDIVIMDLRMPRMSGIEAIREIRKIDGGKTPIIALTAYSNLKQEALDAGADTYLQKPVDVEELLSVLDTFRQSIKARECD